MNDINEHYLNNIKRNIELETQKLNMARNHLNKEKEEFKKLYERKINEINAKSEQLNKNISGLNKEILEFENYRFNMINQLQAEFKRMKQEQLNLEAEKINYYAEKDIQHLWSRDL
jgi:hypothetical protein